MTAVYGASTLKRSRSTKAELVALHEKIIEICELDQPLSVRAVYYRAVSLHLISKTVGDYRKIGREVLKLRRAGDLPYRWITDGTRYRVESPSWASADDALSDLVASYRRSMWQDQDDYVEVWAEKDAIRGIIAPVTRKWQVPLMVARGYSSETFLWNAAQDIKEIGKPATIYQVGDHDYDGIKAWKDIQRKLRKFAPEVDFDFQRLAVTPEQLREYSDLTRDAKGKDAATFGPAMDVDAVPSPVLRYDVEAAITSHIDDRALEATLTVEEQELEGLQALLNGWQS